VLHAGKEQKAWPKTYISVAFNDSVRPIALAFVPKAFNKRVTATRECFERLARFRDDRKTIELVFGRQSVGGTDNLWKTEAPRSILR
jgi:tRNA C32,U32 (ribose-2'-O)-methylase TrmJ